MTLRPNLSYCESRIFDKYSKRCSRISTTRQNVFALNVCINDVQAAGLPQNPLSLNESLLAMNAYAPYHHLYAVAMIFAISSNQADRVLSAHKAWESAQRCNMVEEIVRIGGTCLNMALDAAANEPQPVNRVQPTKLGQVQGLLSWNQRRGSKLFEYVEGLSRRCGREKTIGRGNGASGLRPSNIEYRISAD